MHDLATIQSINAAAIKEHEEINTMSDLDKYIARQIKERPIEARLLKRIVKALEKAGKPVTKVYDGEEHHGVTGMHDILRLVFNLDECWLITADRSWVYLITGQNYDMLTDYTTNLEDALKPVNDWIDKNDR